MTYDVTQDLDGLLTAQADTQPWRVGGSVGRTVYRGPEATDLIGMLDSAAYARWTVAAVNAAPRLAQAILDTLTTAREAVQDPDRPEAYRDGVAVVVAALEAFLEPMTRERAATLLASVDRDRFSRDDLLASPTNRTAALRACWSDAAADGRSMTIYDRAYGALLDR